MKITIRHKDSVLEIEHNDMKYATDLVKIIRESLENFSQTFKTKEK